MTIFAAQIRVLRGSKTIYLGLCRRSSRLGPQRLGLGPRRLSLCRRYSASPASSGYSNQAEYPSRALTAHSTGRVEGRMRPTLSQADRLTPAGVAVAGAARWLRWSELRRASPAVPEALHPRRSSSSVVSLVVVECSDSVPDGGESVALVSELTTVEATVTHSLQRK